VTNLLYRPLPIVYGLFAGCLLAILTPGLRAQAPGTQDSRRLVEGRVLHGSARGERALKDQVVVLHRIASDSAGPVDSVRTSSDGAFRFAFRPSSDDALYIASVRYAGVAYFTAPLRAPIVQGKDADIVVFDTTSTGVPLNVRGRHLVVAAPRGGTGRRAVDVFEIANDTSVTLVSGPAGNPTWTVALPRGARKEQVDQGDIPAGAVQFNSGMARIFAPFSPGMKQLVISYELPPASFPATIPIHGPAVFEVLLEEPTARAVAPHLLPQAPVTLEGHTYQRYLAQDVPADATLRLTVPTTASRSRVLPAIIVLLALVAAALGWRAGRRELAAERSKGTVPDVLTPRGAIPDVSALVNAIAALDVVRESQSGAGQAVDAVYRRRRAELKEQLVALLAVESATNLR
jgi:hypothetical protein